MNQPAEDLKGIMSGITSAISSVGKIMTDNENLEKVLIRYLRSKNITLEGYSIKCYNRNGNLEFKLRGHSVARGVDPERLYHKSRTELLQWENNQEETSGPSLDDLRKEVGRPTISW